MTAESKATSDRPPEERQNCTSPESSGFALLARRISVWTTNGLLTLIVLLAGLAFGKQVLRWWSADQSNPVGSVAPNSVADGLGDAGRPHRISFGSQSWSMTRQSVSGSREAAAGALRASCRRLTGRSELPNDPPGSAEEGLLDRLARQKPVDQVPGMWQIYELDEGFPVAVGVRRRNSPPEGHNGRHIALPADRVVTWGIAVPVARNSWTVYAFHQPGTADSLDNQLKEIPLPPASSKTLSILAVGGSGVVGFRGPAEASTWTRFYDEWSRQHGWTVVDGWRRSGAGRYARFTSSANEPLGTLDVHFAPNGKGGMSGLLLFTPPAARAEQR